MRTRTLHLDPQRIDPAVINTAAELLARGKLVAFPTETVYGLGALALDVNAVASIFEAKGRPATNPLIVHVVDAAAASELARDWPEAAETLASAFWPGPLSIIVYKQDVVPDLTTAGSPKVALRAPAHPVAMALLKAVGRPIAAPSANRSNAVSPTIGYHVTETLDGRIDLVLEAGACSGGLESTVVDVTEWPPRLLRPGLVSPSQLSEVLGVEVARATQRASEPAASPGMLARHYSPRATLELAHDDGATRVREHLARGERVGWITLGPPAVEVAKPVDDEAARGAKLSHFALPNTPEGYAAELYFVLHLFDTTGMTHIVAGAIPHHDDWLAVHDRLTRAAAP